VASGSSGLDLGLPEVLSFFPGLPENEIACILFVVLIGVDTRTRLRTAEIGFAELPISRVAGDAEVYRALCDDRLLGLFQFKRSIGDIPGRQICAKHWKCKLHDCDDHEWIGVDRNFKLPF
jgi:hypothetical protein